MTWCKESALAHELQVDRFVAAVLLGKPSRRAIVQILEQPTEADSILDALDEKRKLIFEIDDLPGSWRSHRPARRPYDLDGLQPHACHPRRCRAIPGTVFFKQRTA